MLFWIFEIEKMTEIPPSLRGLTFRAVELYCLKHLLKGLESFLVSTQGRTSLSHT